jgi:hypothetical protein
MESCSSAGLLRAGDLAGYRNNAVYLRTSRYAPPPWEAVRDAMPAFFDLVEKESEPSVRAVVGHWLFGYIHPSSTNHSLLGSKEPALLCNQVDLCQVDLPRGRQRK